MRAVLHTWPPAWHSRWRSERPRAARASAVSRQQGWWVGGRGWGNTRGARHMNMNRSIARPASKCAYLQLDMPHKTADTWQPTSAVPKAHLESPISSPGTPACTRSGRTGPSRGCARSSAGAARTCARAEQNKPPQRRGASLVRGKRGVCNEAGAAVGSGAGAARTCMQARGITTGSSRGQAQSGSSAGMSDHSTPPPP